MFGFLVAVGIAATLAVPSGSSSTPPDFTGHWKIDPASSKAASQQTMSIDIQEGANGLNFTRVFQDEHGKQVTSHFTCVVGAKTCDFDENGHKAAVSLWYNGPELVLLKTNGEKHEETVEWHLVLSKDGKLLTANREVMEPSDRTEKLVFSKTDSLPAAQISSR